MNLNNTGPVTFFWDMHSGGGLKTSYHYIIIEAPEAEATEIFRDRFGFDPDHVTCNCCGSDFTTEEFSNLLQATGYHRACACEEGDYIEVPDPTYTPSRYKTIEQFLAQPDVLFISASEIKDHEHTRNVSEDCA